MCDEKHMEHMWKHTCSHVFFVAHVNFFRKGEVVKQQDYPQDRPIKTTW